MTRHRAHAWWSWLHDRFYFIPFTVALLLSPLIWMAFFDTTPPLVLYDGSVMPSKVYPGQGGVTVTWHAHFSGRDCGGLSQRSLIDSQGNIWIKHKRGRKGVFHASKADPLEGTVTTPPLDIPNMKYGKACYRVTQFYYCNPLQRWLDRPIVQKSICINFQVVPKKWIER